MEPTVFLCFRSRKIKNLGDKCAVNKYSEECETITNNILILNVKPYKR